MNTFKRVYLSPYCFVCANLKAPTGNHPLCDACARVPLLVEGVHRFEALRAEGYATTEARVMAGLSDPPALLRRQAC